MRSLGVHRCENVDVYFYLVNHMHTPATTQGGDASEAQVPVVEIVLLRYDVRNKGNVGYLGRPCPGEHSLAMVSA